jgi:DNA polymerase III delta prime subunit
MAHETTALDRLNQLFAQLMERYPEKGLGTSSMGKFDPIRRWLADELGLSDWTRQTYAVGSSTAAHNFNSRWVQNNLISGNRVPFGAAFLSVPADANEGKLLTSAMNANQHFVDGSRPTSFEAIITLIQRPGENSITPYAIQAIAGSEVSQKLVALFPGTPVTTVNWQGGLLQASGAPAPKTKVEAVPLSPDMLAKLREAFDEANYQASEDLAGRVISSLAAKPFLLLAGLSGTGKTLLTLALSRWLAAGPEQVQMIAVGADWTSTHHLIGYPDALDPNKYVRTPALELLLRAKEHPELPYFLILDEMNLSHVERYFSDFLSAMESREDVVLHGGPDERDGVPYRLTFPPNLFVVGTINVDETTYMFSPKVIDRANVIEFTVSPAAMKAFLSGDADFSPAAIQGLGAGFGAALADAAGGSAGLEDLEDALAENFRGGLLGLFEVLDRAGLQFGFRTVREMIRFFVVHHQLHGAAWSPLAAFDAQLVQRLLPRLNGDSAKLRPPLIALLAFCAGWQPAKGLMPDIAGTLELATKLAQMEPEALRNECAKIRDTYPLTSDKLARMLKRLAEQGFTTAIEA